MRCELELYGCNSDKDMSTSPRGRRQPAHAANPSAVPTPHRSTESVLEADGQPVQGPHGGLVRGEVGVQRGRHSQGGPEEQAPQIGSMLSSWWAAAVWLGKGPTNTTDTAVLLACRCPG